LNRDQQEGETISRITGHLNEDDLKKGQSPHASPVNFLAHHEFFYALFDSGLEKLVYRKRRDLLIKTTKRPPTSSLVELLPMIFNGTFLTVRYTSATNFRCI